MIAWYAESFFERDSITERKNVFFFENPTIENIVKIIVHVTSHVLLQYIIAINKREFLTSML